MKIKKVEGVLYTGCIRSGVNTDMQICQSVMIYYPNFVLNSHSESEIGAKIILKLQAQKADKFAIHCMQLPKLQIQ